MFGRSKDPAIRVVIIAPADGLEQPWIAALAADTGVDVVAKVGVLQRGVETVQELRPVAVVIDRAIGEIEETLHQIYAVAPQTLAVAVLPQQGMDEMRRMVTAGARDVVAKPLTGPEVVASLRRVVRAEDERRQRAQLPSLLAQPTQAQAGQVVVVMGPKGGVGTTTVATNLAVALRQVTGESVALVDLSLQFGDVAVLLNVWSKHSVHDLAAHHEALDDTLLDRVLVTHGSGVKVLQAPPEPDMAADVSGEQVAAIVNALRARFAYVVVDCWSFVDEITETLAANADRLLLVTTPEVPALKNTKHALAYFVGHGVQRENISLVLNRFPSVKGITLKDIQEHLRHPIQANLPSDGQAVTYAANKGVPVVQSYPKSWVAQSFLRLAAWIGGDKVKTISEAPFVEERQAPAAQPAKRRFALRRG